ncbi:MAG: transcription termination/antitermination NusG family protein [Pseudomonadota bacterium]
MSKRAPEKKYQRRYLEQGALRINRAAKSAMTDQQIDWFAVLVMSGKEFIAQRQIVRFGPVAFVPITRRYRRINRTVKTKKRLAFAAISGMVFVGVQRGAKPWYDIFSSINCAYGVIGTAGQMIAIDGAAILRFTDHWKSANPPSEQRYMRSNHEFEIGDTVRVVDGPLDGHIVDVKDIRDRWAYIVMDLLGQTNEIQISLDNLEKAS